jgi:UDP-glucose 4-epimerase
MRIFLTGGTGFIGSHFLQHALANGHDVFALRRPGSATRIPLLRQPHWLDGALTDDWGDILSDCDSFLHLASSGVVLNSNNWIECFQINVMDSLQLLQQSISAGLKRFVIVGSCFEYGHSGERYAAIPVSAPLEPTTAYGASKAAATMAALALASEYQLNMVVVRPFHVYGDGEASQRFWPTLVSAAMSGNDLRMTSGSQVRDFQPVTDVVQQLLSWLQNSQLKPGKPVLVNLGTGRPQSLLDFARQEWERLGAKGEILPGALEHRHDEVWRYAPMVGTSIHVPFSPANCNDYT